MVALVVRGLCSKGAENMAKMWQPPGDEDEASAPQRATLHGVYGVTDGLERRAVAGHDR